MNLNGKKLKAFLNLKPLLSRAPLQKKNMQSQLKKTLAPIAFKTQTKNLIL